MKIKHNNFLLYNIIDFNLLKILNENKKELGSLNNPMQEKKIFKEIIKLLEDYLKDLKTSNPQILNQIQKEINDLNVQIENHDTEIYPAYEELYQNDIQHFQETNSISFINACSESLSNNSEKNPTKLVDDRNYVPPEVLIAASCPNNTESEYYIAGDCNMTRSGMFKTMLLPILYPREKALPIIIM